MSIRPGVIIPGGYRLLESIGKGSFSEIFSATKGDDPTIVAVKIQGADFDSAVLKWEGSVMQALSGTGCVPHFYASGQVDKRDFLVMELLSGEDMASIRNRARSANPSGLVPLPVVVYLACEMISCLRAMHQKGFIHRDVKPSNFVRKAANSTKFCTIDFGLAKQYREKDGSLRPRKEKVEFRGTTIYASPFVHEGQDQCPRDDLCSVVHVFFDMVCGKLPWGEAARAKDKATVANMKRMCYDDVESFISWQRTQAHLAEASQDEQPSNFPPRAQASCRKMLEYLRRLQYDSEPDYDQLVGDFQSCLEHPEDHRVQELGYTCPGFSWRQTIERASRPSLSQAMSFSLPPYAASGSTPAGDVEHLQLSHLATRVQALRSAHVAQTTGSSSSGQGVVGGYDADELYSRAMRWMNLVRELEKIPEDKLELKLLMDFAAVLQQHQHFFGMALGEEEGRWPDLIKLVEMVSAFHSMSARVRKRKRELLEKDSC